MPEALATRAAINWSIMDNCSGENGGRTSASALPEAPASVDITATAEDRQRRK